MPSPSLHRKIVFLLLLSTFTAAPWAAAGPRRESPRAGKAAAFLVFDLVSRAWSRLTGLQTKEGCHIDPSGQCPPTRVPRLPRPPKRAAASTQAAVWRPKPSRAAASTRTAVQAETGCYIDPSGLCHL